MNKYDLIIIGGGAAGMMATISAAKHHPHANILLVDRTFALGRKILVCGAGRCNITNKNLSGQIKTRYYGANERFLKSIFNQFGYNEIVKFFNELGVELYVERKTDIGKLFPVINQAKAITEMLEDEINRMKVEIMLDTECRDIQKLSEGFKLELFDLKTNEVREVEGKNLILAAGGKTYPALGSNGSGYSLAEKLGHSLVSPVPSALPIEATDQLINKLQGVKMDVEATAIIAGNSVKTRTDELMFTKYGLSGPVILNISREISIRFNREHKNDVAIKLNFVPGYDWLQLRELLLERWEKRPEQTIAKSLVGLFQTKFPPAFLDVIGIDGLASVQDLTDEEIEIISKQLTGYMLEVSGTRGWNEAEFTAGGINTKEVNPTTLESKVVPGLYLAGEIMDVDGDVGGFNLSWSWASGWVAGKLQGL